MSGHGDFPTLVLLLGVERSGDGALVATLGTGAYSGAQDWSPDCLGTAALHARLPQLSKEQTSLSCLNARCKFFSMKWFRSDRCMSVGFAAARECVQHVSRPPPSQAVVGL
jgi:hypothetical protein